MKKEEENEILEMVEKLSKPRACEICGKNDRPTGVHSSGVGPLSCNYCDCCDVVRAEPKSLIEFAPNMVWYNHGDDKYYQNDKPIPEEFTLKSGKTVKLPTRSALAEFLKG